MKVNQPQLHKQKDKGFALVSTVTLMALLMVVCIGMVSLSGIESRTSNQGKARAEAKANARIALMTAIGELQKYAGADQSITAPARIVSEEGPFGIEVDDSKDLYTIAMSTQGGDDTWQGSRTQAWQNRGRILVSGSEAEMTDIQSLANPVSEPDSISLSKKHMPEEFRVRAPLVSVFKPNSKSPSGNFAWWVEGQGAQAAFGLERIAEPGFEALMPDRFNLEEAVAGGVLDWLPDREADLETLQKAITEETVELLAADDAQITEYRQNSDWVGIRNRALLTNSIDGGFKKDLTVALDEGTSESQMTKAMGSEKMFEPLEGDLTDSNPGGPNWTQARSFYNLKTDSKGRIVVRPQTEDEMGVYPVLASFTEYYGISNTKGYAPDPGPFFNDRKYYTKKWVMTFHMSPVVKLWNPYNRPMVAPNGFTVATGNSEEQYGNVQRSIQELVKWHSRFDSYLPVGARYEHRYHIPGPIVFQPGETKIFSMDSNRYMNTFGSGTSYSPGAGGQGDVGDQVNVVDEGYILATLTEDAFTGYSLWDTLWSTKDLEEYDIEAGNYYISGRADGGRVQNPNAIIGTDGSKTNIRDSSSASKNLLLQPGELVTWSVKLYDGKVKKVNGSYSGDPLVSIKNINTKVNGQTKFDPNINESLDPRNDPYFLDNGTHIDATWAKTVSLRMVADEASQASTELNPENHGTTQVKFLSDFNVRAHSNGVWPYEYSKQKSNFYDYPSSPYKVNGKTPSDYGLGTPGNYYSGSTLSLNSMDQVMPGDGIGYSGSAGGQRCILFHIRDSKREAEQEMISYGQLRHANLYIENGNAQNRAANGYDAEDFFAGNNRPTYGIGESRADIRLDLEENRGLYKEMQIRDGDGNYHSTHYDYSYHMNQLWDSVFFSAKKTDGTGSYNPRLTLMQGGELKNDAEGITDNAANLWLEGAFNVNCTNPKAWAAFLAATMGAPVNGEDMDELAPFTRQAEPIGTVGDSKYDVVDVENYEGGRALNAEEIRTLSEALVDQIEQRGPFFSVSDFINRCALRNAPDGTNLMGALQAAIDTAEINKHLTTKETTIDASDVSSIYNQEAFAGSSAEAIPGSLTQGDIITRLGHLLTARSDTFKIRAYGEALDSDGKTVIARAWCEAVVQRMPYEVEQSTPVDGEPTEQNPFGRRFDIIAFRWLNSEEMAD